MAFKMPHIIILEHRRPYLTYLQHHRLMVVIYPHYKTQLRAMSLTVVFSTVFMVMLPVRLWDGIQDMLSHRFLQVGTLNRSSHTPRLSRNIIMRTCENGSYPILVMRNTMKRRRQLRYGAHLWLHLQFRMHNPTPYGHPMQRRRYLITQSLIMLRNIAWIPMLASPLQTLIKPRHPLVTQTIHHLHLSQVTNTDYQRIDTPLTRLRPQYGPLGSTPSWIAWRMDRAG